MPESRPADLCLGLQDDSVFVDFSKDSDDILSLLRISYDGYGCNEPVGKVAPLTAEASRRLLEAAQIGSIDIPDIHYILLSYFNQHKAILWEDALTEHKLLK